MVEVGEVCEMVKVGEVGEAKPAGCHCEYVRVGLPARHLRVVTSIHLWGESIPQIPSLKVSTTLWLKHWNISWWLDILLFMFTFLKNHVGRTVSYGLDNVEWCC